MFLLCFQLFSAWRSYTSVFFFFNSHHRMLNNNLWFSISEPTWPSGHLFDLHTVWWLACRARALLVTNVCPLANAYLRLLLTRSDQTTIAWSYCNARLLSSALASESSWISWLPFQGRHSPYTSSLLNCSTVGPHLGVLQTCGFPGSSKNACHSEMC